MSSVRHRYIVKYIDYFTLNDQKLYLIMEYCDKGDLQQYLHRILKMQENMNSGAANRHSNLSSNMTELGEGRVWKFFIQICLALEVIHDKGIVHSDLKPSNLMMTGSGYGVKLTDFGISQNMAPGYNISTTGAGTLPYMSPEVLKGESYNSKTDVWSLGCILYELVVGKNAFIDTSEEGLKMRILSY